MSHEPRCSTDYKAIVVTPIRTADQIRLLQALQALLIGRPWLAYDSPRSISSAYGSTPAGQACVNAGSWPHVLEWLETRTA